MDIQQLETKKILQSTFIISLLISAYTIWQDDIMNANGYYYLQSAQLFIDNGFSASYHHVGWPFYSILIAAVSSITTLPLDYSALLINSIFYAILAVAIGKIVLELTTDRIVLIIAITLLLAHPKLNDSYRTYIIRDAGYWALYFTAALAFMRFWKHQLFRYSAIWAFAIILATLFRSEGVITLLAAPLLLLLKKKTPLSQRCKQFGIINLIPFALVLLVLVIGGLFDLLDPKYLGKLSQLSTWATDIIPNLHHEILDRASRFNEAVFYKYTYSHGYAVSSILLTLVLIFITETASSLTYLYAPFSFHAVARSIYPRNKGISVITGFIAINAVIVIVFLSKYYFLTGRYVITLALFLLIFASFSLAYLHERWRTQKSISRRWRWGGIMFIFFFIIMTLDGLISTSPSKAHIRHAGYWMQDVMPKNAKVYTNNPVILYYSGRVKESLKRYMITTDNFEKVLGEPNSEVYIAFQINRKDKELSKWLRNWKGAAPVKEFANDNGDKTIIFTNTDKVKSQ